MRQIRRELSKPRSQARAFGFALLTLGALALPGCQSQPGELDATDIVPDAWSASAAPDAPAPALPAGPWWDELNDPQLTHLIELAFDDSPTLAAVWDRLAQARAIAKRAGADLYPQLDADATAGLRWRDESALKDIQQTEDFSIGLVASYEIDLWGRVRAGRDAAELSALSSEAGLQAAAVSLSAEVATTWYRLAESLAQEAVLQQQITTNEQVQELIALRFQQGQVGAADVLRQRQLVESRRGQLVDQQGATAVLRHQLAVLVGYPPSTILEEHAPALVSLPALPAMGIPAEVLRRRPDLREAELAVMAADRDLAVAIANQYPRLALTSSVSASHDELSDLFGNWLATLAANASQPLLDGGYRKAEVERERASVSEAINSYRSSLLIALQETEDALTREAYQAQLMKSLGAQLKISKEVIARTRERYLGGEFEYLRVLEALTSQQSLERSYLTAEREQLEYRIALYRSLAGPVALKQPQQRSLKDEDDG